MKTYKILAGWLAAIVIGVAVIFLLMPIQKTVEGIGVIQPVFEQLLPLRAGVSGITTKVLVTSMQNVEPGTPLFHYQLHGQYGVLAYGEMTKPGEDLSKPHTEPEWYQKADQKRVSRINALNSWSSRLINASGKAAKWEHELSRRFSAIIPTSADLELRETIRLENNKIDRENSGEVQVFDQKAGKYVASLGGPVFVSPHTGTLYTLLVSKGFQVIPSQTVAEIMPYNCPLEILGLLPSGLPTGLAIERIDSLHADKISLAGRDQGLTFQIGTVPLTAEERRQLLPHLPLADSGDAHVIRLRLREPLRMEEIGTVVRFSAVSESKPRIWFWLHEKENRHLTKNI